MAKDKIFNKETPAGLQGTIAMFQDTLPVWHM
jgi:hypothetical protein